MKSFLYLLQKEWFLMRNQVLTLFASGMLVLLVLPYVIKKWIETTMTTQEITYLFLTFSILMGILYTLIQFVTSMRLDIRLKELWLHSPQSIYQLVAAKMLFSLGIFSFYIGMMFNFGFLLAKWEMSQAFLASMIFTGTLIMVQIFMLISIEWIYVCYLQFKRYLGKFAIVIAYPLIHLGCYLLIKFEESALYSTLFHHGFISFKPLASYLPSPEFLILEEIYLLQLFWTISLLVVQFIIGAKWLEKVVTKS